MDSEGCRGFGPSLLAPAPGRSQSYRFPQVYWSALPWKSESYPPSIHCSAIIGPPAKRRQVAFRWRADDTCSPLTVGLFRYTGWLNQKRELRFLLEANETPSRYCKTMLELNLPPPHDETFWIPACCTSAHISAIFSFSNPSSVCEVACKTDAQAGLFLCHMHVTKYVFRG